MLSSKQLSANSEKYFVQKFTKEVIKLWQTLSLEESSQQNETLNYLIFKEFLAKMGFINERYIGAAHIEHDSTDTDKKIIYGLWQ